MTDTTEKLEANKKLARDHIGQVFNQHNPDKAAEIVTGEVIWHGGGLGDIAPGEPGRPAGVVHRGAARPVRGRAGHHCRGLVRDAGQGTDVTLRQALRREVLSRPPRLAVASARTFSACSRAA